MQDIFPLHVVWCGVVCGVVVLLCGVVVLLCGVVVCCCGVVVVLFHCFTLLYRV